MKPKPGVTACPHCGGVSGFFTNIVMKATRWLKWDESDEDTEDYRLVSETKPVCVDCGKSVRSVVELGR